ncbi:hypothetical protein [Iamia sp.]|uniref:hypothetical protein n=1 Tax=Iamia sp. TaxID=2722710 RepID=UPI002BA846E6|nr:hypothetical protein [Iamia sp.]HXH58075.1 hypothetical protein [Iamia sp.]
MGQPIVVVEKPSIANPGMVRFETNRALTGMGHERYLAGTEVRGDRPPDEIARRLLALGGIEAVHVNGSVITVDLIKDHGPAGMREVIESLFIHYPAVAEDEVVVPDADQPETEGELVEQVAAAETAAPDPHHEPARTGSDAAAEAMVASGGGSASTAASSEAAADADDATGVDGATDAADPPADPPADADADADVEADVEEPDPAP